MFFQLAPDADVLRLLAYRGPDEDDLPGTFHHDAAGSRAMEKLYPWPIDAAVRREEGVLFSTLGIVAAVHREAFAVEMNNPTRQRLGAKLSIDGTDFLTGKPADLKPGRMFILEPGQTSRIIAWQEGEQGGAKLLFTTLGRSVAAHVHGDLRAAMTIAAAIFVDQGAYESFVPPSASEDTGDAGFKRPPVPETERVKRSPGASSADVFGGPRLGPGERAGGFENAGPSTTPTKTMGVGAGTFAEQRIASVKGLNNPQLRNVYTLRYMAADDLERACVERGYAKPRRIASERNAPSAPSPAVTAGFLGASGRGVVGFSLGNTPRDGARPLPTFTRFMP